MITYCNKWRGYVTSKPWFSDDVGTVLVLLNGDNGRSRSYISGITLDTIPDGHSPADDSDIMRTSRVFGTDFLQTVMDLAWEHGLRPRGYSDTRESIGAIKAHLEDMRKLAGVK